MSILFIIYGLILGILIGKVWTLSSDINEMKKQYDEELERKLHILDV